MSDSLANHYRGRFAPSPTGPLHFGSLVAALASYLDARHHHGVWLVRMEDLDPPREQPGADKLILDTLQQHALFWDEEVIYQSSRLSAYENIFQQLRAAELIFPCNCTRKAIAAAGGAYRGHCRRHPPTTEPVAWRLKHEKFPAGFSVGNLDFQDLFLGQQQSGEFGDVIVRRKDGLFAYQLAVVLDDREQRINCILRGRDLLDSTPPQTLLWLLLDQLLEPLSLPKLGHLPLALNELGQKLSKQHHAPALANTPADNLRAALSFLNQPSPGPELKECAAILSWSTERWDRSLIPT